MILDLARLLGPAVTIFGALLVAPVPMATAQACPDVEVVFARGTSEPPGVGGVGQAFVDAVRSQAAPRSVNVHPVNYEASGDFANRFVFAQSILNGIKDASSRVEATAATCPETKIVLGGFSQGAVVAGAVTMADLPDQVPAEFRSFVPNPVAPEVANHVAAVTLLGTPSPRFMSDLGAPPLIIGTSYTDKTIALCAPGDSICDGAPLGPPSIAHTLYGANGMVGEEAAFAVGRLSPVSTP
jgi:cutinase